MAHVDSHGAVDLAAVGHGEPGPQQQGRDSAVVSAGLDVPLITEVTEATFESVMANSRTVPVVVVLWSSHSLASKGALSVMEDVAREAAGSFQLAEIDADASPAIAQAFQVQSLPAVVALVGGRPVPLFQGSPVKEQVAPVIEQLLQAASQMGVTGRVQVSAEETEAPTPPEHLPALAAEQSGDLVAAIAAWEKVVDRNPRDEVAKSELARVRVAQRVAGEADSTDPAARADALFGAGDQSGAFDLLLGIIADPADDDQREAARVRLLDLFRVAGGTEDVKSARRRLSTLLLV
ncbi:MAG: tetratricopeptide repeat protein [Pauljensenia sp.]